jgi:hypothetical protein
MSWIIKDIELVCLLLVTYIEYIFVYEENVNNGISIQFLTKNCNAGYFFCIVSLFVNYGNKLAFLNPDHDCFSKLIFSVNRNAPIF